MSTRILITDGADPSAIAQLRREGYEVVEQFYEPEELGAALCDFDIAVIRSATKIRRPQIDAARNSCLKLIIRAGVGLDNIDVDYARQAGIDVRNTPRASSNAVAELAIALMLSCARNISIAGHTMRLEQWEKKAYSKGFELSGKTLGVVGYGRIGQLVGKKGQALGMDVLSYVHRNRPEGCECETMHFVSKEEVFAKADILVLCSPAAREPIITRESIAGMKEGAVLINVSRGSNVDEDALLEALDSGKLRAAGLDVWVNEKTPNWRLVSHPKVSCMPHVGAGTKEAQARIGQELLEIIHSF